MMAVKISQNEEISRGRKYNKGKGVDSTIRQKVNKKSVDI